MKKLIVIALLLCVSACYGQKDQALTSQVDMSVTKASLKITTANDKIASDLLKRFGETVMTRMTIIVKKDRAGKYFESSFYYKMEDGQKVIDYIKTTYP